MIVLAVIVAVVVSLAFALAMCGVSAEADHVATTRTFPGAAWSPSGSANPAGPAADARPSSG